MWLSLIRFRLAAWEYDVHAVNSILNMFVKVSVGRLQDRGIPATRKNSMIILYFGVIILNGSKFVSKSKKNENTSLPLWTDFKLIKSDWQL